MGQNKLEFWDSKVVALIFGVLLLISTVVLVWMEHVDAVDDLANIKIKEQMAVRTEYSLIENRLTILASDISYLHDVYGRELVNPANYDRISQEWIVFSNKRQIYDQIRFIARNGDEKIRVDLKPQGAVRVPADQLQNKLDRYYFYEAVSLDKGSLYISPLDLNVEHNEIELPHKPMIRLGMPIYHEGQLLGIVAVNYLARDFLDNFRTYSQSWIGDQLLINKEGYYLCNTQDSSLEWGFMFPSTPAFRFDRQYPGEWKELLAGSSQLLTSEGLFTILPVNLNRVYRQDGKDFLPKNIYSSDNWYIVSVIPKNDENSFLYYDDYFYLLRNISTHMVFPFLLILAVVLAVAGSNGLQYYRKIHYQAAFDELTKAFNRQVGMEKLKELNEAAKNDQGNFSLCFMDVNGLKAINDNLGHPYGDEMIVTIVRTVQKMIRGRDFIVRLGGDEFLTVLPGADALQAEKVWMRVRNELNRINETEGRPYLISLSHGIVARRDYPELPLEEIISRADKLMYEEKQVIKKNFNSIREN